jgi:hypothetical protein
VKQKGFRVSFFLGEKIESKCTILISFPSFGSCLRPRFHAFWVASMGASVLFILFGLDLSFIYSFLMINGVHLKIKMILFLNCYRL